MSLGGECNDDLLHSCLLSFSGGTSWHQRGRFGQDREEGRRSLVLESVEARADFPSLHLVWGQEGGRGEVYREVAYIVPAMGQVEDEEDTLASVFLVSGFKIPEEKTRLYFQENWKEVSGLGKVLLFLGSAEFKLKRVSLLQGQDRSGGCEQEFQFVVLLEVVVVGRLVGLLDLAQRTREARNSGYVSLYRRSQSQ